MTHKTRIREKVRAAMIELAGQPISQPQMQARLGLVTQREKEYCGAALSADYRAGHVSRTGPNKRYRYFLTDAQTLAMRRRLGESQDDASTCATRLAEILISPIPERLRYLPGRRITAQARTTSVDAPRRGTVCSLQSGMGMM